MMKKEGLRGTPAKDLVNNKSIIVDPDGRKGHTKIDSDTYNVLGQAAKEMKMGQATLIREILHSFCMYYKDAKVLGSVSFFHTPKTYETWLAERSDVRVLLGEVVKMNNEIQKNSQSQEVKIMSNMIVSLTNMMNLTHKTVL